jgi:nanoRNase/pAp phosphatase (c-di-AMP/oligoRNAs hydrolase)
MPVKDGKVGIDKTCSNFNVFELSFREGEGGHSGGVAAVTVFEDAFEENFNFSDDFLTALRWDMGERGAVVCLNGSV